MAKSEGSLKGSRAKKVSRFLRARQVLRVSRLQPRPTWAESITQADINIAKRWIAVLNAGFSEDVDRQGENQDVNDEELWPPRWETGKRSLSRSLGYLRKDWMVALETLELQYRCRLSSEGGEEEKHLGSVHDTDGGSEGDAGKDANAGTGTNTSSGPRTGPDTQIDHIRGQLNEDKPEIIHGPQAQAQAHPSFQTQTQTKSFLTTSPRPLWSATVTSNTTNTTNTTDTSNITGPSTPASPLAIVCIENDKDKPSDDTTVANNTTLPPLTASYQAAAAKPTSGTKMIPAVPRRSPEPADADADADDDEDPPSRPMPGRQQEQHQQCQHSQHSQEEERVLKQREEEATLRQVDDLRADRRLLTKFLRKHNKGKGKNKGKERGTGIDPKLVEEEHGE